MATQRVNWIGESRKPSAEKVKPLVTLFFLLSSSLSLFAGDDNYFGAAGGFAILSADASSQVGGNNVAVSQYKPETGLALNIFLGHHFSDYLGVQGNYIWNANNLTLNAVRLDANSKAAFQETRNSSQHSFTADVLVYFRARRSWIRPYLSAGVGVVHLKSQLKRVEFESGGIALPPQTFSDTVPGLRVAVGADVELRRGWRFRYSFSETVSANPFSDRLSPPGQGSLKNFQNLFGFLKTF
jgi:opacity protein-like surface antigen